MEITLDLVDLGNSYTLAEYWLNTGNTVFETLGLVGEDVAITRDEEYEDGRGAIVLHFALSLPQIDTVRALATLRTNMEPERARGLHICDVLEYIISKEMEIIQNSPHWQHPERYAV